MSILTRVGGVIFFLGLIIFGVWAGPPASTTPSPSKPDKARTLRTKPIEEIRLGERVLGRNPNQDDIKNLPEVDPVNWYEVHLTLVKPSGKTLKVELLRPEDWFEIHDAKVGGTVFLSMEELGAFGDATITYIGPCPELQEGTGEVVTGRFIHEADSELLNIHISGEPRPIGCTANHPFWSETRQEFVSAWQLRPGETLQTATGTSEIERIERRSEGERVYNLEVHRERVYRVGLLGTLVHNNYGGSGKGTPLSNIQENTRGIGIGAIEDFSPGPTQAFSGVYDPGTGKYIMRPSEGTLLANGNRPLFRVKRNGGHVQAQAALEHRLNPTLPREKLVDRTKTIGFTAFLTEKDQFSVAWYSMGVNRKFNYDDFVPPHMRQMVLDAIESATGRKAVSLGELKHP